MTLDKFSWLKGGVIRKGKVKKQPRFKIKNV